MPLARVAGLALLVALLGGTRPAQAEPLTVQPGTDGGLRILTGGRALATIRPRTAAPARRRVAAELVTVEGRALVKVDITLDGQSRRELWLGERVGGGVRPLWTGIVGAQDRDGEVALVVQTRTEGLLRFQTASTVIRCDGQTAQLFPERFDWQTRRFVPTAIVTPAARTTLVAEPASVADGTSTLAGFAFTAASDSAAAAGNARALVAPVELHDGQTATLWQGSPQAATTGYFFTARGPRSGYGLRALRIDLPESKAARPERLIIAAGRGGDEQFLVDLADAKAASLRVTFPRPLQTACVTVLVPAASQATPTPPALAELTFESELDGEGGVARLADDLARGGPACDERLRLVDRMPGLELAKALVERLGRKPADPTCLLRATDRTLPLRNFQVPDPMLQALAESLVASLPRVSIGEVESSMAALWRSTFAAMVAPLTALLRDETADEIARRQAAQALARIELPGALDAMVATVGLPNLRAPVRDALAGVEPPRAREELAPRLVAALVGAPAGDEARREDLLYLLSRRPPDDEKTRALAIELAGTALADGSPYPVAARAIAALGALGSRAADGKLATVLAVGDDKVLRQLAAAALGDGRHGSADEALGQTARKALLAALSDRDPRVRELAARALGRRKVADAGAPLLARTEREPWPFVRRAVLRALVELCPGPSAHARFARTLREDTPELRVVALEGLARCQHPDALSLLVATYAADDEADAVRESAAQQIATLPRGGGDRSHARRLFAEAVTAAARRAQTDLAAAELANAGLVALASLDREAALPLAVRLAEKGPAVMRRMALEALGLLCDGGRGRTILEAAVKNADPWLATTARASLDRCAARAP